MLSCKRQIARPVLNHPRSFRSTFCLVHSGSAEPRVSLCVAVQGGVQREVSATGHSFLILILSEPVTVAKPRGFSFKEDFWSSGLRGAGVASKKSAAGCCLLFFYGCELVCHLRPAQPQHSTAERSMPQQIDMAEKKRRKKHVSHAT